MLACNDVYFRFRSWKDISGPKSHAIPEKGLMQMILACFFLRAGAIFCFMVKRDTDIAWRKSRLAARLVIRQWQGCVTVRDQRIARTLLCDKSVTPRLLDQALASLSAKLGVPHDQILA